MHNHSSEMTLPKLSLKDNFLFVYGIPIALVVFFLNHLLPSTVVGMSPRDWYSGVLNILLPLVAIFSGFIVLRCRPPATIRLLFGFFIGYLALATIAEALFLHDKATTGTDPDCPSVADYFWWGGYALLFLGCLFFVLKFRRLRVPARTGLVLLAWGIGAVILLWFLQSTVQPGRGAANRWALLSYPTIDVFLVALTIMLLKIYRCARLVHYWLFILAAVFAVSVGDTLFFLAGTASWPQPTKSLSDSFLSLSYCCYILSFVTAWRLEKEQNWWLNPAAAKTDKEGFVASMRLALARGSYRATTIGVFFVSFLIAEKMLELLVHWGISHKKIATGVNVAGLQGFINWGVAHREYLVLIISALVAGIFRLTVRPFETHQEHCRHYARLFQSKVLMHADESQDDVDALEKMRTWYGITDDEAKDIELGLLLERREDQFRREEALLEYETSCLGPKAWREWRKEAILLIRRKEFELRARESLDNEFCKPLAGETPTAESSGEAVVERANAKTTQQ